MPECFNSIHFFFTVFLNNLTHLLLKLMVFFKYVCMVTQIIKPCIARGGCVGPGGTPPTISPDEDIRHFFFFCHAAFQSVQFISSLLQHRLTPTLQSCPPERSLIAKARFCFGMHVHRTYKQTSANNGSCLPADYVFWDQKKNKTKLHISVNCIQFGGGQLYMGKTKHQLESFRRKSNGGSVQ